MDTNELEELHISTEELIDGAMCNVPRMRKIASAIYGKPVNIRIEDDGEIWYITEDGEYLTFSDITGRPIINTNNY